MGTFVSHRAVQRDSVQPEDMLDVGCKARSELTRGKTKTGVSRARSSSLLFRVDHGPPSLGVGGYCDFDMHFMYQAHRHVVQRGLRQEGKKV